MKRCFRRSDLEYIAAACISAHDGSKQCRKGGGKGHVAKECTADPKCMPREVKEGIDNLHITGSRRCPMFRRALNTRPK